MLFLFGLVIFRITKGSFNSAIKYKSENKEEKIQENNLILIGSKNTINQIILHSNGEEKQINTSKDFINVIEQSLASKEELRSNDDRVLNFIHIAKKLNDLKILKTIFVVVGGTLLFWSIKYGATVKAGFIIFSFFSIKLIITILPESGAIEMQKSDNNEKVLVTRDTIASTSNSITERKEYDFSKIPVSYEHEYLIDMSKEANWFIKKDSIDYSYEFYLINERDDRAYLQVVAYRDIKHAAIQRRNLIENHHFDSNSCKILYSNNFGKYLYGVTIGDAPRDNIHGLDEIQESWNSKAKSSNVKAFLKIN